MHVATLALRHTLESWSARLMSGLGMRIAGDAGVDRAGVMVEVPGLVLVFVLMAVEDEFSKRRKRSRMPFKASFDVATL